MARIGAFCFPGTGHINPMTALAHRLQQRGHEFVIFGIADTEAPIRAAGVDFALIGESDYPPGTLAALDRRLGELSGLKAFRFTVERVKNTANMVMRDGPAAARRAQVDVLLVDEADMAGSVAQHLNLPYVSIAFFPPLVQDDCIPAFIFGWPGGSVWWRRLRNRLGLRLLQRVAAPIVATVNRHRTTWGLPALKGTIETLSPLAQITQLPAVLQFDSPNHRPLVHYTGPFVDARHRPPVEFPWSRLDGRPLIYASMGTLQNGADHIFRTIAEACAPLNAQLVLSLGGGLDPGRLGALPGDPIVVRYAPQLDLVQRAAAVITHAGLNTTLESLAQGVPLVCLPMGNDQPGVAARVAQRGAGIVLSPRKLTAPRLRAAVQSVLEDPKYRAAARTIQTALQQIDALEHAANLIESTLNLTSLRIPLEQTTPVATTAALA